MLITILILSILLNAVLLWRVAELTPSRPAPEDQVWHIVVDARPKPGYHYIDITNRYIVTDGDTEFVFGPVGPVAEAQARSKMRSMNRLANKLQRNGGAYPKLAEFKAQRRRREQEARQAEADLERAAREFEEELAR